MMFHIARMELSNKLDKAVALILIVNQNAVHKQYANLIMSASLSRYCLSSLSLELLPFSSSSSFSLWYAIREELNEQKRN